jgi:hypothetical protein
MAAEIHQEGLKFLLECAISEKQTPPVNFYVGLSQDVSLAENATLASITEVTGTGYARQPIASTDAAWTSATAGTNDWKLTAAAAVTFTATASDWTDAKTWFLATSIDGSGKLIASGPLSETRSLVNGDSLNETLTLELDG